MTSHSSQASQARRPSAGHTVLAVPVPPLNAVVRTRTAFYDASFVSNDPDFTHAHITVLAPWVAAPTPADLAAVAGIAATTPSFTVTLAELGQFPDGIIHLVPDPQAPLRGATTRLAAAFPAFPPYEGRFGDVVPHLTVDRRSTSVTVDTVRDAIAHLLPLNLTVDRIDLQWWANHECRRLHTWQLARDTDLVGGPR